jgi:hypothetical protein
MSVLCISTAIHPPVLLPTTLPRPLRALCFLNRAPAGPWTPSFARGRLSAGFFGRSSQYPNSQVMQPTSSGGPFWMPFGPDRSELVPLSLPPQPCCPGLLQLLVALGRPAAAPAPAAVAAATFLVCAGPTSGSCPVPGWLFLGWPAPLLPWPCRLYLLQLLVILERPAVGASAAVAAAAAAPGAACAFSPAGLAGAADVAVLHHSLWAGLLGAAGAAVPNHSLWAGHPAPPAPLLPWLCRSCLLPLLDPSHLWDDRQAQSCRPQPVLPWAQWPTAFLCPSSP